MSKPRPEGKKKQTTRLRKYVCPICGQIIRAATDKLLAWCIPCQTNFVKEEKKEPT